MAGITTGLSKITDDPRVNLPASEILRIEDDKKYYQDDLAPYKLKNSYGYEIKRKPEGINVTKMASRSLASLIFNERCSVNLNDNSAQALIDDVLKDNDFYLNFENHLEKWIALGSGCVRPYVEDDKIKLSWADADQTLPLSVNTNAVEDIVIAFKSMRVENHRNIYYTLLEFHQRNNQNQYTITNELYRSIDDPNRIGDKVPLGMLDDYANLSEKVTFSDNVKDPLFAFYVNPGANNKSMASPMGLGLIDNAKSIVDAINRTHTEFIWEVQAGQRRILVPETFLGKENLKDSQLKTYQNPHPPMFDPDTTVYKVGYGMSEDTITDMTSNIRVQDYTDTMYFFLHEFENATGLSQGTFTVTPSGVQTATEVVTNNSKTYQTRSSYLTQAEKTIKGLVRAILTVANCPELFSDNKTRWSGDLDKIVTNVDFADGVFVDRNAQKTQDLQAVTAGVMPKLQFLMRNYDLNEATAREWLSEIQDEQQPADPDFEQFNPNNGGEDNDNTRSDADDGSSKQDS